MTETIVNIADYIVSPELSILDTMKIIDKGARAIAFVCKEGHLLAAVSDGDIRRYIIGGGNLKNKISTIANYHPVYIYAGFEMDSDEIMTKKCISALPVVSTTMKIISIMFKKKYANDSHANINLPVVIMAGGKGTRLHPYTQILPKPLIPIGDLTITEHIMNRFEAFGCTHFDIVVNYQKNFIKSYFQDNERHYDITFLEEPEFWGTAGGLKLLHDKYEESFFVTNCDILVEAEYDQILASHREQENIITMVCASKEMIVPYGTVEVSETGRAVRLKEKPQFSFITNTGLYLIRPDFLEKIPNKTFIHITDVIQKCIDEKENVGVFVVGEENWLDMGQLDELERMKKKLETGK